MTASKGYFGNIARIDLTSGKVDYDTIVSEVARKYIGGSGIAAHLLWEETSASTAPFSADNLLIFVTGPLTASMVPSSSRYIVAGISPLTGIWGKASGGGKLAYEMRHAGFDGIVIKGESTKPVYIWLHDGKVEIRDARWLWGTDTYDTTEQIISQTDADASVACIGQAGEKLARIACIMSDGRAGRASARCGLGALMGAKKLKAIAAKGSLPLRYNNEDKLKDKIKKIYAVYPPRNKDVIIPEAKAILKSVFPIGGYPVKNWSGGTFEEGMRIADDVERGNAVYCKCCPYGCGESVYTKNGERHMVWEAWGPLGTNCLVDNIDSLQEAYSLCNRYGLDSISAGGAVAFAMECFEKGLINNTDTDGLELKWGNDRAVVEMVRKIGMRQGFGKLLGEGVKKAAEQIGGTAIEYAMHVKGLEFPAHDPRAAMGGALAYATGSIGATHMEAAGIKGIENYSEGTTDRSYPEFGYPAVLNRFDIEGKGVLVAKTQNYGTMLDSIGVCLFLSWRLPPSVLTELLNILTGVEMDLDDFMLTGERVFNYIRMLNVRRGISRKDDTLPDRFLCHKRGSGGAAESLVFLGSMLNDYYSYREWSEEGIPTREKLIQLGLDQCL